MKYFKYADLHDRKKKKYQFKASNRGYGKTETLKRMKQLERIEKRLCVMYKVDRIVFVDIKEMDDGKYKYAVIALIDNKIVNCTAEFIQNNLIITVLVELEKQKNGHSLLSEVHEL